MMWVQLYNTYNQVILHQSQRFVVLFEMHSHCDVHGGRNLYTDGGTHALVHEIRRTFYS